MTEKEVINKLHQLRQIKPRKDWVVLTKTQILGEEVSSNKFSQIIDILPRVNFRRVLVPAFSFCLPFVILAVSQNALPGDNLYPVKKFTEKTQAVFVSESEKSNVQLGIVNKRLEELNKIASTNQTDKIAPAIEEYQASLSEAVKNLTKAKNADVKEIVQQAKKIEESKQKAEVLGINISEASDELNSALLSLAEREIKDLENRTLNEAQQKLLIEAKENFEAGNYSQALEKIWEITQWEITQ